MKYYRSITGYLAGIVNKPDKFNDKAYNWHLTIVDGDDTYIMQVRERSGYGRSLMKSLPNVDFNEKITFSPYVKVVDDKKRGTLYLQQRGENVDWYFTQEHRTDFPNWKNGSTPGERHLRRFGGARFLPQICGERDPAPDRSGEP
ncbi:MAG: hypothetical protein ACLR8Y_15315 [Alistipes indistinctus]